jgi:threonine/homoserine/homoserine lactone efflux protein
MLSLFFLVSAISFVGSLHPGPVNLAVAQTTLVQGPRAGLWLALGGSLPEFAYAGLAASSLRLIPSVAPWTYLLAWVPVGVLLVAGMAAFRQKPLSSEAPSAGLTPQPFWKGFLLGSTNPQLLPFWSAVWLYLSANRMVPSTLASLWLFALATSVGAFGLLAGVVWLAGRQRARLREHLLGHWVNRLTGSLFVGMAIWQGIRALGT